MPPILKIRITSVPDKGFILEFRDSLGNYDMEVFTNAPSQERFLLEAICDKLNLFPDRKEGELLSLPVVIAAISNLPLSLNEKPEGN